MQIITDKKEWFEYKINHNLNQNSDLDLYVKCNNSDELSTIFAKGTPSMRYIWQWSKAVLSNLTYPVYINARITYPLDITLLKISSTFPENKKAKSIIIFNFDMFDKLIHEQI